MHELGKRIKTLRKEQGISMEELGRRTGVARSTIAGYESGLREPPLGTLRAIAKELGTSTDFLLNAFPASPAAASSCNRGKAVFHWGELPLEEEDLAMIKHFVDYMLRKQAMNAEGAREQTNG